mmetsp:Transcript_42616/g.77835  ORF Transcript_42616/g.77835 Transcript_42616/m.77835 type:complete len:273 (+) Transcript_42616:180-998(+)
MVSFVTQNANPNSARSTFVFCFLPFFFGSGGGCFSLFSLTGASLTGSATASASDGPALTTRSSSPSGASGAGSDAVHFDSITFLGGAAFRFCTGTFTGAGDAGDGPADGTSLDTRACCFSSCSCQRASCLSSSRRCSSARRSLSRSRSSLSAASFSAKRVASKKSLAPNLVNFFFSFFFGGGCGALSGFAFGAFSVGPASASEGPALSSGSCSTSEANAESPHFDSMTGLATFFTDAAFAFAGAFFTDAAFTGADTFAGVTSTAVEASFSSQ